MRRCVAGLLFRQKPRKAPRISNTTKSHGIRGGRLRIMLYRGCTRRRLYAWLGLLIAMFPLESVSYCTSCNRSASFPNAEAENGTSRALSSVPRECWIFIHLVKAGGSTVNGLIHSAMNKMHASVGLYTNHHWMREKDRPNKGVETKNHAMTFGAYTEALRPHRGQSCKWFTMFRHPISRLVSAYFYCKQRRRDELCATVVLDAGKIDLHTFAEHWGNYALRQFSLAFLRADEVFSAEQKRGISGRPVEFPGWYRVKEYFQDLKGTEEARALLHGSTIHNDLAMHRLLRPVEDLISQNYSAVGILEQWEESMTLFNRALKVPNFDWRSASNSLGRQNTDERLRHEEADALRSAWDDPVINDLLWLDLLLYNHAVSVHDRQMAEHGIK